MALLDQSNQLSSLRTAAIQGSKLTTKKTGASLGQGLKSPMAKVRLNKICGKEWLVAGPKDEQMRQFFGTAVVQDLESTMTRVRLSKNTDTTKQEASKEKSAVLLTHSEVCWLTGVTSCQMTILQSG